MTPTPQNTREPSTTIKSVPLDVMQAVVEGVIRHNPTQQQTDAICEISDMTNDLLIRLRAYVLGENLNTIVVSGQPVSWWQHFKQDCMPGWFTNLFPVVKHADRTFDASASYPDLKFSIPRNQSRVVVRVIERFQHLTK